MGGSQSQEFMVYTDAGEDLIASCPSAATRPILRRRLRVSKPSLRWNLPATGRRSWFHARLRAISDVAEFFKISPASDIKCVAYMALKRGGKGKAYPTPGTASRPSCAATTR
jgi:prolyl-tRNA synthetase